MESLHYLLMKSQALLSRKVLSEAGRLGLTPGQPKVLDFLLQYREAEQKTIAAYCEIERATVGSILLRMEEAGLVQRRQKEGNRRSLYVSLTPRGEAAARELTAVFRDAEEQALGDLSAEERQQLSGYLTRLCQAMKPGNLEKEVEK